MWLGSHACSIEGSADACSGAGSAGLTGRLAGASDGGSDGGCPCRVALCFVTRGGCGGSSSCSGGIGCRAVREPDGSATCERAGVTGGGRVG